MNMPPNYLLVTGLSDRQQSEFELDIAIECENRSVRQSSRTLYRTVVPEQNPNIVICHTVSYLETEYDMLLLKIYNTYVITQYMYPCACCTITHMSYLQHGMISLKLDIYCI
jgi:hypothetical protein